jgi:hypothetical protein
MDGIHGTHGGVQMGTCIMAVMGEVWDKEPGGSELVV